MTIDLVITGFKTRQYDSKAGKKTAHDLFVADADANPVTRMSSEMQLVLDDEEYEKLPKNCLGASLKGCLKQFIEVRGVPKYRGFIIEGSLKPLAK